MREWRPPPIPFRLGECMSNSWACGLILSGFVPRLAQSLPWQAQSWSKCRTSSEREFHFFLINAHLSFVRMPSIYHYTSTYIAHRVYTVKFEKFSLGQTQNKASHTV